MLKNIFRHYSTYVKKCEKIELKNLIDKMKNYKFYCDTKIYPCHCLYYGEPCKLYNNKDAHINFAKHILHLNTKKNKQLKSNTIFNNHLDQWYF